MIPVRGKKKKERKEKVLLSFDPNSNEESTNGENGILTVATTSGVDLPPFQLEVLKQAHVV